MSNAGKHRFPENADHGGRSALAIVGIVFVAMIFVGVAASSVREGAKSSPASAQGYDLVRPAQASDTSGGGVSSATDSNGITLSVPVGTPYPAPADSAATGNPTDMTY